MPHNQNNNTLPVLLPALLAGLLVLSAGSAASQTTDAAFRLIGVIESESFTGAVLGDNAGNQTFYRLREDLPDGSRIIRVESGSIRIRRSDSTVYELFIVHDMKPTSASARLAVAPSPPPVPAAAAPLSRSRAGDEQGRPDRRSVLRGAGSEQPDSGTVSASPRGSHRASPRSRQASGE